MSHVIRARNVEQALGEGFAWLKVAGRDEPSRNGPVRVAPGPVITEYLQPTERVLFNADRDANPVFHLLESLWMLAGSNEAKFLLPYNARMAEYSESNGLIHGAYGFRWRNHFEGGDQLKDVVEELTLRPDSRQAVLAMWDPDHDLLAEVKDRPCNTHIYFDTRPTGPIAEGHPPRRLNMTVCCRSNDALWGAYGANAVHLSILQEVLATELKVPVGVYRQMSNNLHAYTAVPVAAKFLDHPPEHTGAYPHAVYPLLQPYETMDNFLADCKSLVHANCARGVLTSFFHRVVIPLKNSYDMRKAGEGGWKAPLEGMIDCDWKTAYLEWTARRGSK